MALIARADGVTDWAKWLRSTAPMPRLSRRPRTTRASPWSRQRRTSVKAGAGDGAAGDRGNGMTLARRDIALMLTHGLRHPTRGSVAGRRPSKAFMEGHRPDVARS